MPDNSEIASLRNEIHNLSAKTDRQHEANQRSQAADRDTFRQAIESQQRTFVAAMDAQRTAFQDALNRQFISHTELDKTVDRHKILIGNIIGEGQPGEGRLGLLEVGMEVMKKFRWQALAVISLLMWVSEVLVHHGK
jgi:hypothetical protein